MNRIRMMVLFGILGVGGLWLAGSSAHAQVRSGTAPAPAPPARYYYGPGSNGYAYYSYPTAPTAPTYRGGFYTVPAPNYRRDTSTRRFIQEYTGRQDGLARPWLRPLP